MSTVDDKLENARETIEEELPADISVTNVTYEGPELVIYTRHPKRFAEEDDLVRIPGIGPETARRLRNEVLELPDPQGEIIG